MFDFDLDTALCGPLPQYSHLLAILLIINYYNTNGYKYNRKKTYLSNMIVLVQKVSKADVKVDGKEISSIKKGLMLLVGIKKGDTENVVSKMADKISKLRIFEDDQNKMNLSIQDVKGSILAVSQFTLMADTKKGNRPSFIEAEKPEKAEKMFDLFVQKIKEKNIDIQTGRFQTYMQVNITNEGPTTIILEIN